MTYKSHNNVITMIYRHYNNHLWSKFKKIDKSFCARINFWDFFFFFFFFWDFMLFEIYVMLLINHWYNVIIMSLRCRFCLCWHYCDICVDDLVILLGRSRKNTSNKRVTSNGYLATPLSTFFKFVPKMIVVGLVNHRYNVVIASINHRYNIVIMSLQCR